MQTWIALFRGINVGGNNILPMAELRSLLEGLGLQHVRSYIQSGNLVFQSKSLSASPLRQKIAQKVQDQFGFRPPILLLKKEQLLNAVLDNPFPEATSDPKSLHFLFLLEKSKAPDLASVEQAQSPTERFQLTDDVFYLHAPDGIGRSKLSAKAEKCLGVSGTGRNYRTVMKLLDLVGG